MAYHLEQLDHHTLLRPLLTNLTNEPPDMFIVTADGETVETHKLLFCLFSKTLASILADQDRSEVSGVSIPLPAVVVKNLIRILKEGRALATDQNDLLGISSCDSILGIDFKGMQMGHRKKKSQEKSNVDNVKDDIENDDDKGQEKSDVEDVKDDVENDDDKGQEKSDNAKDDVDHFLQLDLEESDDNFILKHEVGDSVQEEAEENVTLPLNKENHKCSECRKKFKNAHALNRHLKFKHSIILPVEVFCKDCEKTFSSGQALRNHVRLHTGEKPYSCNFCGKPFTQQANLKSHLLNHDKDSQEISDMKEKRKVDCGDCGKTLINKQVLERHKKSVHSDDMPFKCSECDKYFKLDGNLKLHMITHSDARSFQCSRCNFSFKRKSELMKHVKNNICKKKD